MLVFFALGRSAAHGQVFQRAAKTGQLVPLEVRKHNHGIGFGNGLANGHGLEMLAARNGHFQSAFAGKAVGDDQGRIDRGVRIAVLERDFEVIDGIVARPGIQGIGVGEKGLGLRLAAFIHHHPGKHRVDEGIVAFFAKVHLDGREHIAAQDAVKPGGVKKIADFGNLVVLGGTGPQIDKINLAAHFSTLPGRKACSGLKLKTAFRAC